MFGYSPFIMTRTGLVVLTLVAALPGCALLRRPHKPAPPPPDAARPVLKHASQLAAERAERIRSGKVVVTPTPTLKAEARRSRPAVRLAPKPGEQSIRPDILMVNDTVLTVPEVLYPLRGPLEEARRTLRGPALRRRVAELVREAVRSEIGRLLVYHKAIAALGDPQKEMLKVFVDQEVERRVTRDFGGSMARFEQHLAAYGLTLEQYRAGIERAMVVRDYTTEMLMPRVQVRRGELLAAYQAHRDRYSTPQARELLLIAAPFDAFVPPGTRYSRLDPQAQAAARLRALKHIRRAYQALKTRPFAEVAREFSRGPHAADGGSWGMIGKPLKKPPYDQLSRRIFQMQQGQYTEPIETDVGYFIVGCGRIRPARTVPFEQVQDELAEQLKDERFNRLAARYISRLADRAAISSLDTFIQAAVEAVVRGTWPPGAGAHATAGASPG